MTYLIALSITSQALAYNPTLEQVGLNRQQGQYLYQIRPEIDVSQHECRVGLPYGYQYLTGSEVYFLSSDGLAGPFLVTDYESPEDKGDMSQKNILADIDCIEYVHKRGWLFVRSASRRY